MNILTTAPARPALRQLQHKSEPPTDSPDRFQPGTLARVALGGAALVAVPGMAMAGTPQASSAALGALSQSLSSGVMWAAAGAAGIGFLLGSVPKNDGWGFDSSQALSWGIGAGLAAGGLGVALNGAPLPGLLGAGLGAALVGAHWLGQERPTVSSVKLEPGLNTFPGDQEPAQFKAAQKAYHKASFEEHGGYATRGRIEWECGEKGADSDFVGALRDGCKSASHDMFDILVLLARNVPAAQGQPAVVVVRGADQLRQLDFGSQAIKLPDGQEIPYSSVRAGVGYAWRS